MESIQVGWNLLMNSWNRGRAQEGLRERWAGGIEEGIFSRRFVERKLIRMWELHSRLVV